MHDNTEILTQVGGFAAGLIMQAENNQERAIVVASCSRECCGDNLQNGWWSSLCRDAVLRGC